MSKNFYTPLQRRLHWMVILLLLLQYALQMPMSSAVEAVEQQVTLTFVDFLVVTMHSWGGLIIAGMMLWRWQLRSRVVPLAEGSLPPTVDRAVRFFHITLYVVVLLMALTGAMHYYLGIEPAHDWHRILKWVLAAFVGVHVVGALFHATQGSRVFHRMMGRNSLR